MCIRDRLQSHRQFPARTGGTLVCPIERAPLADEGASLVCSSCGRHYYRVDGIPVVVADLSLVEHDEIDHHEQHPGYFGEAHKSAQAAHFDRAVMEEFEISRPHATPRLYQFLLGEKYRRAIGRLGPHLPGVSALTVCGGSGMDAEFLARSGARVVATDVSVGAARRAKERARRYSLAVTPVVADVERLPFANRSFDVVFVHDGLHHLERPEIGLREMARVARRWVSDTEPARAAATSLAVRAGVALEREESGNRVARLNTKDVVAVLSQEGFRPLVAERYAMYYRHQPGPMSRALSNPLLFPIVRTSWKIANGLLGRFGNKVVVLAERDRDNSCGD
jgi:SAM-dependent methyltransferase